MASISRTVHFLLAALGILWASLPLAGQVSENVSQLPRNCTSESLSLPIRLGTIDAINGSMHLKVPLSPQLPGRIPFAFNWTFESQPHRSQRYISVFHCNKPTPSYGDMREWEPSEKIAVTATVHGEPWTFFGNWYQYKFTVNEGDTNDGSAYKAMLRPWGVTDFGEQERDAAINEPDPPTSRSPRNYRFVVIGYGVSADGTRHLYQTGWLAYEWFPWDPVMGRQYNSRLVGVRSVILYGANAIWNGKDDVHFTNRWGDHVRVTGDASPSFPKVVKAENVATGQWITYTDSETTFACTNNFGMAASEGTKDTWGMVSTLTMNGATTTFAWETPANGQIPTQLKRINHPNGLQEDFFYSPSAPGQPLDTAWKTVEYGRIAESGQYFTTERYWPRIITYSAMGQGGAHHLHLRDGLVRRIDGANGAGPWQGLRITYGREESGAYWIKKVEDVHGVDETVYVDGWTLYDGWSRKAFANPEGLYFPDMYSVGASGAYPQTNRAYRTRTFIPSRTHPDGVQVGALSTMTLQRAWDAYGPTVTDTWTGLAASEETSAVSDLTYDQVQAIQPALAPHGIHKQSQVERAWSETFKTLRTHREAAFMDGPGLPSCRDGVTSVDLGTKVYTFDEANGLVRTATTTRGAAVTCETYTYEPGLPLVRTQEVTQTYQGNPVLPDPDHPAVQAGKRYTYDETPHHWLATETDLATGHVTRVLSVDDCGRPTLIADPAGVRTRRTFDTLGRPVQEERLASGDVGALRTETTYDPNGRWKTDTVYGEGRTLATTTTLDAFGRVTRVQSPDNRISSVSYDGMGRKKTESAALPAGVTEAAHGVTTYSYDPIGRCVETLDPKNRRLSKVLVPRIWQTTPSGCPIPQGYVTQTLDARGYTRTTVEDAMGQKRYLVDQMNGTATYHYDREGLLKQTNQNGQIRQYTHDELGRLTSRTEPEEGTTTFSRFTLAGTPLLQQLTSGARVQNIVTTLGSGLLPNTIVATDNEAPTAGLTRSFQYEQVGTTYRLKQVQETQAWGTFTQSLGYDALNRVTSKTLGDALRTFTVSRTLDAFGNQTTLTYPSLGGRPGKVVETTFDAYNRPQMLRYGGALRATRQYTATLHAAGWSDVTSRANGVSTQTTLEQGDLTRVQHMGLKKRDGSLIQEDHLVTWHPGGLLATRGQDRFEYDPLQRLASAHIVGVQRDHQPGSVPETVDQTFLYDAFGNRTSTSTTWSGGSEGGRPEELYTWSTAPGDHVGNRLPAQIQTPSGPQGTGVQYDAFGRITQVLAIPGTPTSLTQWSYDAEGRVVTETVGAAITDFLLDAEGLRFRRAPRGSRQVHYTIYGFNREPLVNLRVGIREPLVAGGAR